MIIECGWHKRNFGTRLVMGQKEPISSHSVSHGMCKDCEAIENRKLDEIERERNINANT